MSLSKSPLISLKNWSLAEIKSLISFAEKLKNSKDVFIPKSAGLSVVTAFFEPSTRTKTSFGLALNRLGIPSTDFIAGPSSSMVKGESFVETFKTIEAMNPSLIIVRASGKEDEVRAINEGRLPIINAGLGAMGHPTQALLDAMTIKENIGLDGVRILFVGDARHSRVVQSNVTLLSKIENIQFGFCGPKRFAPQAEFDSTPGSWKMFENLPEALGWANVCMGLRVQVERHRGTDFSVSDYVSRFRLNRPDFIKYFSPEGLILHPGPHVPEVDFSPEIFEDPRCLVRDQVTNGVYVRMAAIVAALNLEVEL